MGVALYYLYDRHLSYMTESNSLHINRGDEIRNRGGVGNEHRRTDGQCLDLHPEALSRTGTEASDMTALGESGNSVVEANFESCSFPFVLKPPMKFRGRETIMGMLSTY